MLRILIADDHPVVRQGLRTIFDNTDDLVVGGEAGTGEEVLQKVAEEEYDLVLLDLSLPGKSGIDILNQWAAEGRSTPRVLVLSVFSEEQYAFRALKAGASGYITKKSPPPELVAAVRKIGAGGKYISARMAELFADRMSGGTDAPLHEGLSAREFQVLTRLAAGRTTKEIAAELQLSVRTVFVYRSRVLEKMHMTNNAQIAQYAAQNKLIEV